MKILKNILKKFDNTPKIIETQSDSIEKPFTLNIPENITYDEAILGINNDTHKQQIKDNFDSIMKKQFENIKNTFSNSNMTMDSGSFYTNQQFPYNYDNNVMDDMLIQNNLYRGFPYYAYYAVVPMVNN